jgi:hypothetical protein
MVFSGGTSFYLNFLYMIYPSSPHTYSSHCSMTTSRLLYLYFSHPSLCTIRSILGLAKNNSKKASFDRDEGLRCCLCLDGAFDRGCRSSANTTANMCCTCFPTIPNRFHPSPISVAEYGYTRIKNLCGAMV